MLKAQSLFLATVTGERKPERGEEVQLVQAVTVDQT